jgi:uncharacterized SAM-binding protein YcdF (DUF218 family)
MCAGQGSLRHRPAATTVGSGRISHKLPHGVCRIFRACRPCQDYRLDLRFLLLALPPALAIGLGRFIDRRRIPPSPVDAALVFGTGVPWKAASRVDMALWLDRHRLVRHFIVSGAPLMKSEPMTEAEWLRTQLMEGGVAANRILVENRATNTAQNVEFSLAILERHGFSSVVLVMSDFEGIRAHLTARRAWIGRRLAIYDCHARSIGHWHAWTWWLSREGWSLTWFTVSRLFRYRLLRFLWSRP